MRERYEDDLRDSLNELPDEMLLKILNAQTRNKAPVLNPADMTAVALACPHLNNVSSDAKIDFIPCNYNAIRKNHTEYSFFKHNKLNRLYQKRRWQGEKNGELYYDKGTRNLIACIIGLVLSGILALALDLSYPQFFSLTLALTITSILTNNLMQDCIEAPLNPAKLKEIPLQFYNEKMVNNNTPGLR